MTEALIVGVLACFCLSYPEIELYATTLTLESSLAATSMISKDYYLCY